MAKKTVEDKEPIIWDLSSTAVSGNWYGRLRPSAMWWAFCMYIYLLIILIIVASCLFADKYFREKKEPRFPYKKQGLMTEAELAFFKVLQEAVQDKYYIVPQVQLSKLVGVEKNEKYQKTYLNKIDRKSVDFVLFDKDFFLPKLVIELDDSSHNLPVRKERDYIVNMILSKAEIKIEHIKTSYKYDLEQITILCR